MLRPILLSAVVIAATGCTTVAETVETPTPQLFETVTVEAPALPEEPAIAEVETVVEQPEPGFEDLAASDWTVQIAALKNLERIGWIELDYLPNQDVLHVPTHDDELGDLHAVLVGTYDTYEEAAAVAERLPKQIAGDEPWIRSVASVQAVMR